MTCVDEIYVLFVHTHVGEEYCHFTIIIIIFVFKDSLNFSKHALEKVIYSNHLENIHMSRNLVCLHIKDHNLTIITILQQKSVQKRTEIHMKENIT